jgi:hypothetical protein
VAPDDPLSSASNGHDDRLGSASNDPDASATGVDEPIADIMGALAQVHDTMARCAACENFRAVVARVQDDLEGFATPAAGAAREQLAVWLAAEPDRVKTTNRCEICVPTGPYERFAGALRHAGRGSTP